MKKTDIKTNFLGLKIVSTSVDQLLKILSNHVKEEDTLKTVFTPNPEQLVYARSHSSFDKVLGKADYLLPDGIGIVIGSKLLSLFKKSKFSSKSGDKLGKKPGRDKSQSLSDSKSNLLDGSFSSNLDKSSSKKLSELSKVQPILERITGVDVVAGLLNKLEDKKFLVIGGRGYENLIYEGWRVVEVKFGLGGQINQDIKDDQDKMAILLSKSKQPNQKKQKNIYWSEAFLNVTLPTSAENEVLTQYIKKLKPDVIFVALGAPHQEEWIIENKALLETNGVGLAMVVGGAFDMLLNKVQRAPKLVQRIGLEWLFRLYKEPWRWRRQVSLLKFVRMVVRELVG